MAAARLETIFERLIHDRELRTWHVREARIVGDLPGALNEYCLIFDSGTIVRRFWRFPKNWLSLDDDALVELLEGVRVPE